MNLQARWDHLDHGTRRNIRIGVGIVALVGGLMAYKSCSNLDHSANESTEPGPIYGKSHALVQVGQINGKYGVEVVVLLNPDGSLSDVAIDYQPELHRDIDGKYRNYDHVHVEDLDAIVTVTNARTGRSRVISQGSKKLFRP